MFRALFSLNNTPHPTHFIHWKLPSVQHFISLTHRVIGNRRISLQQSVLERINYVPVRGRGGLGLPHAEMPWRHSSSRQASVFLSAGGAPAGSGVGRQALPQSPWALQQVGAQALTHVCSSQCPNTLTMLKKALTGKRSLIVRGCGSAVHHHPSQSPEGGLSFLSFTFFSQSVPGAGIISAALEFCPCQPLSSSSQNLCSGLLAGVPDLILSPPISTPFVTGMTLLKFKSKLPAPLSKILLWFPTVKPDIQGLSCSGLCLLPQCSFPATLFSKHTTPSPISKPLLPLFLLPRMIFLLLQKPKYY